MRTNEIVSTGCLDIAELEIPDTHEDVRQSSRYLAVVASSMNLGDAASDLNRTKQPHICGIWVTRQLVGALVGLLLCTVLLCIEFSELYPRANDMAAIGCFIACFWVFEVLPLPVTSLFPVILFPVFGIASTSATAKSYAHWLIMMFVGAFIVDGAIVRVNLHKRIALYALLKVGVKRPWLVLLTFMTLSWVLSMFCTNTATTVMLVPFATGLLDTARGAKTRRSGASRTSARANDLDRFSIGVLLGICYAATLGGTATVIGTAPNGVLAGQEIVNGRVNFADWFAFAFPISLFMESVAFAVLYFMFVRGVKIELSSSDLIAEREKLGPLNRDELIVASVQALQVVGFFIRKPALARLWPGINDASVACFTAVILFFVPSVKTRGEPVITWESAQQDLPWGVLLLMGGGFALAAGFQESGLTNVIGETVSSQVDNLTPVGLTVILVTVVTFLTELTSNTATANIMMPIMSSVAFKTLTNPLALMLPVGVACSFAFMLPAATPPNMVVFATGRLQIFDFVRAGIFLNLAGAFLGSLLLYLMASTIFDITSPFPQWACTSPQTPPESECVWVPMPGVVRGDQVAAQACVPLPVEQWLGNQTTCQLWNTSLVVFTPSVT